MAAVAFALALGIRWPDARLAVIFLTILLSQLSISALNDWADRDRDAAAHRPRPVAVGRIPPAVALGLAIVVPLGMLPGALAFGPIAGTVLVIGLLAGWAYDLWLKPTALSFLPFAVAFPLLPTWVGLVAGRSLSSFIWLIPAGAFLAAAIHLADSLPDIKTDAASGLRTLAVQLGSRRTIAAISGCIMVGGLIVLAAVGARPLLALVVAIAAVLATVMIVRAASRRPQAIRWVAAGYGVLAAISLISVLPDV
jgi:4-hydroxybenzoate polyprenyltransferase